MPERWGSLLACSALLVALLCAQAAAYEAPRYDKRLLASRLNQTVEFCDSPSNETCALDWINRFGSLSDYFTNILNRFTFSYANRFNKDVGDEMLRLSNLIQRWGLGHTKMARRFLWQNFTNKTLRRRFLIMVQDTTLEDSAERQEQSQLQKYLMESYSRAAACPDGPSGRCLPQGEQAVSDELGDPDVSYDRKAAIWRAWYDAAASSLAANFTRYVALANKGARAIGYPDAGVADWRFDFQSDAFNSDVLTWYRELADLYRQLHAYVRHRLSRRFPGRFDPAGCLPAHILGHDQWAQMWRLPLEDLPHPRRAETAVDFSELLNRRYPRFLQLVNVAEEFYTSLGMAPMTQTFWNKSDFAEPTEPGAVKDCHASAWDFASTSDFRIKMCGRVDRENFYTIHHEMGHIEYFMAYSRLPREFRGGANSGFHEAIGDTVALSVDNRGHYAKLGLVQNGTESPEEELNGLFLSAMDKVAFLPFSLATGIFRWLVFNGTASPDSYNQAWWRLRAEFGGVCPPVDRPGPGGFDAGAKYHVALDVSYIRYYFSFILQFQLHRRMCQLSGHTGPINRCDFYQSKAAGEHFWKMLKQGTSRPWKEVLLEFTGQEGLQTSAILEYYRPLHSWLTEYNRKNNVPVGWQVPDNVLKGVGA